MAQWERTPMEFNTKKIAFQSIHTDEDWNINKQTKVYNKESKDQDKQL